MSSKKIIVDGVVLVVQEDQILRFQVAIESLVGRGDMSYIEAVSHYCETSNIDLDAIQNLISIPLMEKLYHEAKDLYLLKPDDIVALPL
jgi:hypothetical protein